MTVTVDKESAKQRIEVGRIRQTCCNGSWTSRSSDDRNSDSAVDGSSDGSEGSLDPESGYTNRQSLCPTETD